MLSPLEITGRARSHVVQMSNPRFAAQPEVARAFMAMREAAMANGFDLEPISTFRDYKTQLRIWNQKFLGQKPVFDKDGHPLDVSQLSNDDLIRHILGWSALPGASRHHWGTEIDVIDRAALPANTQAQLLPQETTAGGVFYELHCWLDENIADYDFFRPYRAYQGGVSVEPWHLSYAPISLSTANQLSLDLLTDVIRETDIAGKTQILQLMPDIFQNYVCNYTPPLDTRQKVVE